MKKKPEKNIKLWRYLFLRLLDINRDTALSDGAVEYAIYTPYSTTRPLIAYGWWSVMLKDRILVAEHSITQQLKWSHDLQHSTLAFTGLDGQSDEPDPINRLVMSSPSSYMIVPTVFFKLLLWQTSIQPYFILKVLEGSSRGLIVLR